MTKAAGKRKRGLRVSSGDSEPTRITCSPIQWLLQRTFQRTDTPGKRQAAHSKLWVRASRGLSAFYGLSDWLKANRSSISVLRIQLSPVLYVTKSIATSWDTLFRRGGVHRRQWPGQGTVGLFTVLSLRHEGWRIEFQRHQIISTTEGQGRLARPAANIQCCVIQARTHWLHVCRELSLGQEVENGRKDENYVGMCFLQGLPGFTVPNSSSRCLIYTDYV